MAGLNSNDYKILLFLIAVIFIILIFGKIAFDIRDFNDELYRLNIEIRRTSGAERKQWKKRRVKLWLSLLPFVKY